jgi:DNA polymerase III delta prime subunit
MNSSRIWVDKYRPKQLEEYVWANDSQKKQVMGWIAEKEIPSMLLVGQAGVGKTSLAKLLFKELNVDESDIRYVNASNENGVEFIRKLQGFIETMPNGNYRYVLLDESDMISFQGQGALRNMIESYSNSCRWILTANYAHKIIPALHSRLQGFQIVKLDKSQFVERAATILLSEGIDLNGENFDILEEYVAVTYPDLRKCLNMLQQNCTEGKLQRPENGTGNNSLDYMVAAVNLIKTGKLAEARKMICSNARKEDYEEIYRLLYRNLDWWSDKSDIQDKAVVIIANRLKDHAIIADEEINLSACLIELGLLS